MREKLRLLLEETEQAHKTAEANGNYTPWPIWYAEHMEHRLHQLYNEQAVQRANS